MYLKIKSLFFLISLFLSSALIIILFIPLAITRSGAFFVMRVWSKVCLYILKIFCNLDVKMEGEIKSSLGNLIACKHQSTLEILILCAYVDKPVFFLKSSLLYVPFMNLYLLRTGQLAVRRWVKNNSYLLDKAKKRLEDSNVIIFPEGTRVDVNKSMPYHSGVIILAKQANVDILPMSTNTGYFWPRRAWLKKAGVATVNILNVYKVEKSMKESLLDLQILIDTDSKRLYDQVNK